MRSRGRTTRRLGRADHFHRISRGQGGPESRRRCSPRSVASRNRRRGPSSGPLARRGQESTGPIRSRGTIPKVHRHGTRNPSANIARADDTTSYGRSSRRPPLGSRRWSRNSSIQELESPNWKKPCGKPECPRLRQGRINPAPSIPESMDYRALGLKVGLEIHQQLATHKLFCEDASVLVDSPGGQRFRRRLRPTQSELGEIDAAALEEAKRRLTFVYEAN